jgi:hypothetical protein
MDWILEWLDTAQFYEALLEIGLSLIFVGHLRVLYRGGRLKTAMSPQRKRRLVKAISVFGIGLLATILLLRFFSPLLSFRTAAATIVTTAVFTGLLLSAALLEFSFELNSRYGKRWVKFLDLPYLLLGVVGLVRLLNTTVDTRDHYEVIGLFGVFSLTGALSIRFAKAIIEVFFDDWY